MNTEAEQFNPRNISPVEITLNLLVTMLFNHIESSVPEIISSELNKHDLKKNLTQEEHDLIIKEISGQLKNNFEQAIDKYFKTHA